MASARQSTTPMLIVEGVVPDVALSAIQGALSLTDAFQGTGEEEFVPIESDAGAASGPPAAIRMTTVKAGLDCE
jgi:hypothetical protein